MYIATMSVKDNRTYVIWETLESEQEEIYNIVNESVGDPELLAPLIIAGNITTIMQNLYESKKFKIKKIRTTGDMNPAYPLFVWENPKEYVVFEVPSALPTEAEPLTAFEMELMKLGEHKIDPTAEGSDKKILKHWWGDLLPGYSAYLTSRVIRYDNGLMDLRSMFETISFFFTRDANATEEKMDRLNIMLGAIIYKCICIKKYEKIIKESIFEGDDSLDLARLLTRCSGLDANEYENIQAGLIRIFGKNGLYDKLHEMVEFELLTSDVGENEYKRLASVDFITAEKVMLTYLVVTNREIKE